MALTEQELKLAGLAIDPGAGDGEWRNAAVLLFLKLRKRNATVDDFRIAGADALTIPQTVPDWGLTVCPFKKHRGEMFKDIPPDYLKWLLGWIYSEPDLTARFGDLGQAIREFFKQSGAK
jgi:uncharacterized protein (DUF3820 family)